MFYGFTFKFSYNLMRVICHTLKNISSYFRNHVLGFMFLFSTEPKDSEDGTSKAWEAAVTAVWNYFHNTRFVMYSELNI